MKAHPGYLYETHLHTSESSVCARNTAAELIAAYAAAGYAGIVVTDHFFNGNTTVPSEIPWPERIERYCRGYEAACAAAREPGLSVFFGWEFNYRGTEFLTYGLDREFLLDNPGMHEWGVIEYLETVRGAGGFVSHAHPFRQRAYIDRIRLFPKYVDAVEVFNPGDPPACNDLAGHYARAYDLAFTAGSDKHQADPPSFGLEFDHRLESSDDLVACLRRREARIIKPA